MRMIKKKLTDFLKMMNEVYINFTIPEISPLEKFNNSLITEILSMFIVNNCETINIETEAKLYLKALIPSPLVEPSSLPVESSSLPVEPVARGVSQDEIVLPPDVLDTNEISPILTNLPFKKDDDSPPSPRSVSDIRGGAGLTKKILNDNNWVELEESIRKIKETPLYAVWIGSIPMDPTRYQIYFENYKDFIKGIEVEIKLIVGVNTFKSKTTTIKGLYDAVITTVARSGDGSRNFNKSVQQMFDTIKIFIFNSIIKTFEDFVNRNNSLLEPAAGSAKISIEERENVQRISQLVAQATLGLTDLTPGTNPDLNRQIEIIRRIADDSRGYTTIDENLLDHFQTIYTDTESEHFNPNLISNELANDYLVTSIRACTKDTGRAINNAIPDGIVKDAMMSKDIFVCPTSSVCDGMGAFGSCMPPRNKEYQNMNFIITDNDRQEKYYEGSTTLKGRIVNVNYGFKFENLEIYNFLDINLETQPIILQANYTFKSVINRIIEIWKSQVAVSDIERLWDSLRDIDFFLSILKLGSQKAVGDIFQEINSTLDNGGYIRNIGINGIKTYGLMGDRPSGIRVIKLLKDGIIGINPNACGGYIGNKSLIYVPNDKANSVFIGTIPGRAVASAASKKKGSKKGTSSGGSKKTNKKTQNKNKKTNKKKQNKNKKTNKNKRNKKHKKTQKK